MAGYRMILFKDKYPELLKHFTNPSNLSKVMIGDKREFEVKCFKGHRRSILLRTLIKERRVPCDYCFGRLVYPVSEKQKKISLGLSKGRLDKLRNDLWYSHPQHAKQLINSDEGFQVKDNTTKELDFICTENHISKLKVNTKTSIDPRCGYCSRRRLWHVTEEQLEHSIQGKLDLIDRRRNDFLALHPEITDFLVDPRAGAVLSSNTIVEVWCKKKLHKSFKPLIKAHQCGYCSGKKVFELTEEDIEIILSGNNEHLFNQRNDLYKFFPKESMNLKDTNDALKVTRNQKVILDCVCPRGHTWRIEYSSHIVNPCKECVKFSEIKSQVSLTEKYSSLLKYWDYGANLLDPSEVHPKRGDKFYWICVNCKKSFKRSLRDQNERITKECKSCATQKLKILRAESTLNRIGSLSEVFPELAKEYSSTNEIPLDMIHIKTYCRALWNCSVCNYSWRSLIKVRVSGGGDCPKCSGKILNKGVNDLATVAPHLLKDWDENYDPSNIKANSSELARWRCSSCSYQWRSAVKSRAIGGSGCMKCFKSSRRSKGHQGVSDFVQSLGYAVINDARPFKSSQMEIDVFVPELNIGIEYNGDYWHSDRVSYSKWGIAAKERHEEKLLQAKSSGIVLAYVWESDWLTKNDEVKDSLKKLLEENILSPIISKLAINEKALSTSELKLDSRKPSSYFKPIKNLSEEQYEAFKERYLEGESPHSIGENLNFNINSLYKLIRANSLVEERLKLGVSKNGVRTVPLGLYEQFKKDFSILSKAEILDLYKISNKELMKLATSLKLVKEGHYKSLEKN